MEERLRLFTALCSYTSNTCNSKIGVMAGMQRFTRKNGRILVKSEVDREVERRELATTGSVKTT